MIEKLTVPPEKNQSEKQIIDYLKRKINEYPVFVLDIGQKSQLTEAIINNLRPLFLHNTFGDLDDVAIIADNGGKEWVNNYDYIIYSHTIEHQFNPLNTLELIKMKMSKDSKLFIILPSRPKFLWTKNHYHEIDNYRMKLLIERAGMRIISTERHKVWRKNIYQYWGIRPFLRLFFEYSRYYEIML